MVDFVVVLKAHEKARISIPAVHHMVQYREVEVAYRKAHRHERRDISRDYQSQQEPKKENESDEP